MTETSPRAGCCLHDNHYDPNRDRGRDPRTRPLDRSGREQPRTRTRARVAGLRGRTGQPQSHGSPRCATLEDVQEIVSARAQGPAAAVVAGYTGYRSAGVAPAEHRGLPSPWLTVIVTLDEPLRVEVHPDPKQPGGEFDALVGGLHTRPALLSHNGWQSGVQLHVSPLAARALLGVPASELAGMDLHAEDVLGARVASLRERLVGVGSWPERFAVLDYTVGCWLLEVPSPAPEVTRVWRQLLAGGGTARVDQLAREVGWSARHLGVRFREETGLSPKAAARVIRFHRVRRALQDRPALGLSQLAVDHGYYDQAHLTRDFGALAGLSPTRWLQAEGIGAGGIGFVQDTVRS